MNDENELNPPVLDGYTKIPTFKLWIANQFPYIETDFDAITNYELLQAVIKYLNTIIENENKVESNVTALYNSFVNLHDYVENYFDNLDVQEEINNKLDEMVEDGTLTTLIENYVNPYIEAQNQEISQFKLQVNSQIAQQNAQIQAVESGSPLVASSVQGMTDTTRVYVNTTDGNWYYYNGSAWTIGGVYQSTGIEDGSVFYQNLDDKLKENFIVDYTEIDITENTETDKYISISNNRAVVTNSTFFKYHTILLEKNVLYDFLGFNEGTLNGIIIVDENENVVYNSNSGTNNMPCATSFCTSNDGYKAYFNVSASLSNYNYHKASKLTNLKFKTRDSKISSVYNYNNYLLYRGANSKGQISLISNNNFSCKVYKLSKNISYHMKSYNSVDCAGIVITDMKYSPVYISSNQSYSQMQETEYDLTPTEDCYAFISSSIANGGYEGNINIVFDDTNNSYYKNIFSNKNLVTFGDSITWLSGNQSWIKYMKEKLNFKNFKNYALSGATWSNTADTQYSLDTSYSQPVPNNVIWNQYNRLVDDYDNDIIEAPDVIAIFAGTNDQWFNRPYGNVETAFDFSVNIKNKNVSEITTVAESIRYVCELLLDKFPNVQIIISTMLQRGIIDMSTIYSLNDIVKKCGDRLSIEVIDQTYKSGIYGYLEIGENHKYLYDGTHPNSDGAKKIGYFIANEFLNKIIK